MITYPVEIRFRYQVPLELIFGDWNSTQMHKITVSPFWASILRITRVHWSTLWNHLLVRTELSEDSGAIMGSLWSMISIYAGIWTQAWAGLRSNSRTVSKRSWGWVSTSPNLAFSRPFIPHSHSTEKIGRQDSVSKPAEARDKYSWLSFKASWFFG